MERTSNKYEEKLVGASLLCFSVDPTYGYVYFLLGKERHNSRWPSGSGRWSDFGGGSNDGESAETTAAREFMEETLAVVKYFNYDVIPRTTWTDIAEDLVRGNYTLRLTQGDTQRKFVVFVKQIPWDPASASRFAECRSALTRPRQPGDPIGNHPAIRISESVRKEYLEKRMLSFWSVPQLRYAVNHNGVMTHRGGYVEHCRKSFIESLEIVLSEMTFAMPGMLDE